MPSFECICMLRGSKSIAPHGRPPRHLAAIDATYALEAAVSSSAAASISPGPIARRITTLSRERSRDRPHAGRQLHDRPLGQILAGPNLRDPAS